VIAVRTTRICLPRCKPGQRPTHAADHESASCLGHTTNSPEPFDLCDSKGFVGNVTSTKTMSADSFAPSSS
jgi:hypothetical protein